MYHALIFSSRANYWERSSGAHRIATYLRKNGMDVEVVDFTPYWDPEILKEFVRTRVTEKTLFFGFSVFFNFWPSAMKDFAQWLKKEYPHIKTVVGGHSILQADITDADIWVDSYGEEAILALAKSLAGNTVNGIAFSPEFFGSKKVIKALQSYPAYNLGDYSIVMEKRDFVESWEWLTVEFSRGCKFSCSFCNFPVLGVKEDTSRTQESFEREMKYNFDTFGVSRYIVADETFNDRVEKITKFADVVESLNFPTLFSGFVRADLLSQANMIEELARMNFAGQYYGIETFNHQSGKIIGKGLDPEKVKALILKCKDYFKNKNQLYRGTISLIVGLPYDTPEQWIDNMAWLETNWIDQGLVVFPLMVEDLEITSKDEYTNISKFSSNLKKYGLRSIGTKKTNRYDTGSGSYNWKEGNFGRTENLWEHDTMNIFQAKEISEKAREKTIRDFKLTSFELSWPETHRQEKIDNLASVIDVSVSTFYPGWEKTKSFIDSYSLKKLN